MTDQPATHNQAELLTGQDALMQPFGLIPGVLGVGVFIVGIIQVVVSAAAADESFNASVEEVLVGAVIGLVVAALTTAILLLVRSDR